jgi:hypothetical protein
MKIAQYFFGTLCALSFTGLAFTSVLVEHEVVGLLVLHLFCSTWAHLCRPWPCSLCWPLLILDIVEPPPGRFPGFFC